MDVPENKVLIIAWVWAMILGILFVGVLSKMISLEGLMEKSKTLEKQVKKANMIENQAIEHGYATYEEGKFVWKSQEVK